MISDEVQEKAEQERWLNRNGEISLPVNVCSHCGEDDDPETTSQWPEDLDADRICYECDKVDVRCPITVTFDLSIDGVPRRRVQEMVDKLLSVVAEVDFEKLICEDYENIGKGLPAYGTRYNSASLAWDTGEETGILVRETLIKGRFHPWKPEAK